MKRNWLAIAALSTSLSADALVLTSLLWVILKQGGTGQAVGLAAFFMASVPYVLMRFSPSLGSYVARMPARAYLAARALGLLMSGVCAAFPGTPPTPFLYVIACAFALVMFLTSQSLETILSLRVFAKELSPNTASRLLQTSFQVGTVLGGTLSGYLIEWGGFRAVAVVLASIYAFGALTIDTIAGIISGIGDSADSNQEEASGSLALSKDAESPAVWGAFIMIGLVLVNVWAFSVLVPYIAGLERHWSARAYGLIEASAGVGALFAAFVLTGRLRNLAWLGFAGIATSDLWLATSPTVLQASLAATAAGFFGASIRLQQRELIFRAASNPTQATRWAGNLSFITFLTRALVPLAAAGVIDRLGGATCFQVIALTLLGFGFSLQLMQILAIRFRPMRRRPVVVLVDAYSSGAALAPEFIARGHDCVHIMSSAQLAPVFYNSLREEDFIDHLLYQGSMEETIEELRKHRPKLVIAASEPGVELADLLSERLGLITNGTHMSAPRRNKYLQIEAMRNHGLLCAKQAIATSVDEGVLAARKVESWPVVLKPLASSATDLVRLCASEEEVREAMRETLGRKSIYGKYNDEILVQGFLHGTEHAVDTISIDGRHRVTGIWRYEKAAYEGAAFTFRQIELLDSTAELAKRLSEYALAVLDVLDIKNGPAHQEIMLTADGPALVECNARLCGGGMPPLWQSCTGVSLPGLVAEAYVEPKAFLKTPDPICRLEKHGRIVLFSSQVDHCILNPGGLKAIQGLESFVRMILTRRPEDVYPRTVNLITIVGQVQLAHADPAVVERDARILRNLEASGLYVEVSAPREHFDRPFSVRRPQLVRVKAPVEIKQADRTP